MDEAEYAAVLKQRKDTGSFDALAPVVAVISSCRMRESDDVGSVELEGSSKKKTKKEKQKEGEGATEHEVLHRAGGARNDQ